MHEPTRPVVSHDVEIRVVTAYDPMYSFVRSLISWARWSIGLVSVRRCFCNIWAIFGSGEIMSQTQPEQAKSGHLHLHEGQVADKKIVVHPTNDDLFVLTGKQMIASCSLSVSIETWLGELELAREAIDEWCQKHSSKIIAAYLIPRPSQLAVYLVRDAGRFDFDLADESTELVTDLIRDYNLGMVELFQIPPNEVERFVDVSYNQPIYGSGNPTHRPMEA